MPVGVDFHDKAFWPEGVFLVLPLSFTGPCSYKARADCRIGVELVRVPTLLEYTLEAR